MSLIVLEKNKDPGEKVGEKNICENHNITHHKNVKIVLFEGEGKSISPPVFKSGGRQTGTGEGIHN